MVETKLIPGFRFHPTDVELVMYFLKRKIMGRKFPFDVIGEIDIYKYAPWDLPDKALLRSGDLKWYFFSQRGKKYSVGGRMNRGTEFGYWKTTGKDRSVEHKSQVVGMIRTLVFHTGKAPKGDRTDWVMHEFRLEDKELADKGIPVDSYVICRVFQKEGPGPRNGAQYGKPFNEKDWDSEEEIDCVKSVPIAAVSTPAPIIPSSSHIPVANDMHRLSCGCIGPTSLSCLSRLMPSSSTHPSAPSHQVDDDIVSMLAIFKDDNTLAGNENNGSEKVDNPGQANNAEGALYLDPNEIFKDLGDLDSLVGLNERDDISYGQTDEYTKNKMLFTGDVSLFRDPHGDFLELIDLEAPLFWETKHDDDSWGQ